MCNVLQHSITIIDNPPISAFTIGLARSTDIKLTDQVRDLGVIFDSNLNFRSHINNICRASSLAVRINIGRVRKYLSRSQVERLIHAFISSKLDYCNSLLYGLPSSDINKLQRIQNIAARLVTGAKRRDSISAILEQLVTSM